MRLMGVFLSISGSQSDHFPSPKFRRMDEDLAEKRAGIRFDLDRLEDPALIAALSEIYPEATPVDAAPSVFDY